MQNLTKTDRLGLLLSGKVNVLSDNNFLHPILPCEFLDSPEFESSRASVDDKFKVRLRLHTHLRLHIYFFKLSLEISGAGIIYFLLYRTFALGGHRGSEFLSLLVLAEISLGISPREGNLPCYCLDHAGGERYRDKALRNE